MTFWKFYAILISILVILVGGAIYGPSLIDWNDHKSAFRTAIFATSGCHVAIDGDLSMDLLPVPKITLDDVRLTEDSEIGTPDIVAIKGVYAWLSFKALLVGNIKIERLELRSPRFLTPLGKTGLCDANTPSAGLKQAKNENAEIGIFDKEVKLSIKHIGIMNGAFAVKLLGKKKLVQATNVDFQIDLLQNGNKAKLKGKGFTNDLPFEVEFSLTGMAQKHAPSMNAIVDFPTIDGRLMISGKMTQPIDGNGMLRGAFNGKVAFDAKDPTIFFKNTAPDHVTSPRDAALTFGAEIQATSRYIGLNNYHFKNGPLHGTGAISINLQGRPTIDVIYSAKSLNLDSILENMLFLEDESIAILADPNSNANMIAKDVLNLDQTIKDNKALMPQVNLAAVDILFNQLTHALDADISLDMTVGAFKYLGAVVRDAGLHATFGDGTLTLDRASAIFPGRANISVFGFMEKLENIPQFVGNISMQSNDFKRFLNWIGVGENIHYTNRLRSVEFDSDLRITPNQAALPSIVFRLDTSRITGGVGLSLNKNPPKLMVDLQTDNFNFDAYFRQQTPPENALKNINAADNIAAKAPTALPIVQKKDTKIKWEAVKLDADIRLAMAKATLFGEIARDVRIKFDMLGDELTLDELTFDRFATIGAKASGHISEITNTPIFDLDIDFSSANLSSLLSGINMDAAITRWAHDMGAIGGTLSLTGPIDRLVINNKMNISNYELIWRAILSGLPVGGVLSIENGYLKSQQWRADIAQSILSYNMDNLFSIDNLEVRFVNGRLTIDDLSFNLTTAKGYEVASNGHLEMILKNGYLKDLDGLIDFEGAVNANFNVTSSGLTPLKLWTNKIVKGTITGEMAMNVIEKQSGGQLEGLQFMPISNLKDFVTHHFGTSPHPLTGIYQIKGEKLTLQTIDLKSPTATVQATGQINLGQKNTKASLDISENGINESYLTMTINGPWERPVIKTRGRWTNKVN